MSNKIEIDTLQSILIDAGVEKQAISLVLEKARKTVEEEKEDRAAAKLPKQQNKFVVMVRGDKALSDSLHEAWVVQVKEAVDESTVIDRLTKAVHENNRKQTKQKFVLSNWRDVFTFLKRKFTKSPDIDVLIKTKAPVRVIVLQNEKVS